MKNEHIVLLSIKQHVYFRFYSYYIKNSVIYFK